MLDTSFSAPTLQGRTEKGQRLNQGLSGGGSARPVSIRTTPKEELQLSTEACCEFLHSRQRRRRKTRTTERRRRGGGEGGGQPRRRRTTSRRDQADQTRQTNRRDQASLDHYRSKITEVPILRPIEKKALTSLRWAGNAAPSRPLEPSRHVSLPEAEGDQQGGDRSQLPADVSIGNGGRKGSGLGSRESAGGGQGERIMCFLRVPRLSARVCPVMQVQSIARERWKLNLAAAVVTTMWRRRTPAGVETLRVRRWTVPRPGPLQHPPHPPCPHFHRCRFGAQLAQCCQPHTLRPSARQGGAIGGSTVGGTRAGR